MGDDQRLPAGLPASSSRRPAIILMTAPILLPIITAAGFDPVWFGVILTINMEIGLITPPVGLNLYVVNAIAPDVPANKVIWGSLPYVLMHDAGDRHLVYLPGYRHMAAEPSDGGGDSGVAVTERHDEHLVFRRAAADHFRARAGADPLRASGAAPTPPARKAWSSCATTCSPAAARPPAWRWRARSCPATRNSPPGRASPFSRRWPSASGPITARMEAAIAAWRDDAQ